VTALLLAALITGELDPPGLKARVAAERPRVVVVNFWASWCPPCLAEFPELIALAREHKDVRVISVTIDDLADRPAAEKIVAQMKPPFPVYLKAKGPDEEFINAVDREWSGAVPFTLVFDAAGKIKARLEGEQTKKDIESALPSAVRPKPPVK
jgi:thiol-disulfide isomerase/thioredoxin